MGINSKSSKSWIAGLFTAVAASLCCITPVMAFLGGAGGLASSFSRIEPFRPYLIGSTLVVFSIAWYQKLKVKREVDCDCETGERKKYFHSKSFLGIITIVSGLLISFPYYANVFYPKQLAANVIHTDKDNIQHAFFKIKGMTCEGCTQLVNSEISKVNGVIYFETSYKNASSTVKFDKSKTSIDSIAFAIQGTGYKIVSQTLISK